jgi:predicted secreted Zn-dependent protease
MRRMTEWNLTGGDNTELWGETLQELFDEMTAIGPEAGSCSWDPHYTLSWDDSQTVTGATVTVGLTILTPAWAKRSDATEAVRAEWDRWASALMTHEQGHAHLAEQYLDNIEAHLIGTSKTAAEAFWTQNLANLQLASDAYDTTTQHGITQGTTLDTSIT